MGEKKIEVCVGRNEKGEKKKGENFIINGVKRLKIASFWVINSRKSSHLWLSEKNVKAGGGLMNNDRKSAKYIPLPPSQNLSPIHYK